MTDGENIAAKALADDLAARPLSDQLRAVHAALEAYAHATHRHLHIGNERPGCELRVWVSDRVNATAALAVLPALIQRVEQLSQPEWFNTDCGEVGGDYDYVADFCDLEAGQVMRVSGARSTGQYWIACVPTEWAEDGVPITGRHHLHDTEEMACEAAKRGRA